MSNLTSPSDKDTDDKKTTIVNRDPDNETIELSLPVNPAYVSAARLTASSIANRLGFDADEIEDLKAAVSEACIFIIKNAPCDENTFFKLIFVIRRGKPGTDTGAAMKIEFNCDSIFPETDPSEEMGLMMIKALMDEMVILTEDKFSIQVMKNHKTSALL